MYEGIRWFRSVEGAIRSIRPLCEDRPVSFLAENDFGILGQYTLTTEEYFYASEWPR